MNGEFNPNPIAGSSLGEEARWLRSQSQEEAGEKEQRGHCPGALPPPLTAANHVPCLH